jgi:protein-S-isoprenylcysteine O-methyltransferase Ste14
MVSAGSAGWLWGWVYIGLTTILLVINSIVLPREVIAERGRRKENIKRFDKVLSPLLMIPYFGLYLTAGFDQRFGWSPSVSFAVHLIGVLICIFGWSLTTWAMISNRFFSTAVRIQSERGHTVETGGPYRLIRHPGYTGMILTYLGLPLFFGSYYSFIPSAATIALLVIRTTLEDKALKAELNGYPEYSGKVKYRLIPMIW